MERLWDGTDMWCDGTPRHCNLPFNRDVCSPMSTERRRARCSTRQTSQELVEVPQNRISCVCRAELSASVTSYELTKYFCQWCSYVGQEERTIFDRRWSHLSAPPDFGRVVLLARPTATFCLHSGRLLKFKLKNMIPFN